VREHHGRQRPTRTLRTGLPARASAVVALTLALSLSLVTPSLAEPDDRPVLPSKAEVQAAEAEAARRASDVGAIRAQLLMANHRLEAAATEAEQASEAYNGAIWRLDQAKEAVGTARLEASRARRTVVEQRDVIGALVASSYQQGSELSAANAMMSADGPEGVLDQYATFQGASSSLQADYGRFAATDALAQVFEQKARDAELEQARVAAQARETRADAVAAASSRWLAIRSCALIAPTSDARRAASASAACTSALLGSTGRSSGSASEGVTSDRLRARVRAATAEARAGRPVLGDRMGLWRSWCSRTQVLPSAYDPLAPGRTRR